MLEWLTRVAAWMSQTLNLFLLFGHHDQTVSARCYVNRHHPGWNRARKIINAVFFWQPDHCYKSHMADVAFAQQVTTFDTFDKN
ncbi:hypothetical protein SLPG_00041 [Salicola phage CGphi29]|uniref:hypothetical protein n=1 Tax=Salicola phage CGphi29 TaxID=754067 RepID=UPI0002C12FFA|nr:hypothetical protein SLPG_00041 [Salicola phage CGphi29]AGH31835.1 hypothetical protein SLPG_00041 [Salicola phage CGphi29]